MEKEKISSIILTILGIVIVIDTFLEQFFNIGTKQNSLVLGYCITFYKISKYFKEKGCNISYVYNGSPNGLFFNYNISFII